MGLVCGVIFSVGKGEERDGRLDSTTASVPLFSSGRFF